MAFTNLGLLFFYRGFIGLHCNNIICVFLPMVGEDQPVIRKFTWFSYIGADDIREKCKYSSNPQYRFVYNGVYNEQVRTYDIYQVEKDRYEIKLTSQKKLTFRPLHLILRIPIYFSHGEPKYRLLMSL